MSAFGLIRYKLVTRMLFHKVIDSYRADLTIMFPCSSKKGRAHPAFSYIYTTLSFQYRHHIM